MQTSRASASTHRKKARENLKIFGIKREKVGPSVALRETPETLRTSIFKSARHIGMLYLVSRAPVDDPVDQFLENKVYIQRPSDPLEWALSYKDAESRDLFQKAFNKE